MKNTLGFLSLFSLLCIASASGSSLDSVAEQGRQEAREALRQLQDFREKVAGEHQPLESRIRELRNELESVREELDELRSARDSRDVALDELQRQVNRSEAQRNRLLSSATEVIRSWELQITASERAEWKEVIDQLILNNDADPGQEIEALQKLLPAIVDTLLSRMGGNIHEGFAFSEDGSRTEGTFLHYGPALYFAPQNPSLAAGIITNTNPLLQNYTALSGNESSEIRGVIQNREGLLPLDPTDGSAMALRAAKPDFWEQIRRGGIWIYPILAAAVLALIVILAKFMQFWRIRGNALHIDDDWIRSLGEANPTQLEKILAEQSPTLQPFWRSAAERSRLAPEALEDLLYGKLVSMRILLMKGLPILSVIAATTPLLGLLGTVTGMITTFQQITVFGTGDPQNLSGGISEALLTTKFGLIVAIPTFIFYALLSRRAQGLLSTLEQIIPSIVHQKNPPSE